MKNIFLKNKYKSLLIIIFGLLAVFVFSKNASATVGGPTYISQIGYSAKDNAVYYTVHDDSGRGCPPIVHKIDLTTQKDLEVKSCDQFEQEYSFGEEGMAKYNQFISDIYGNLSYLGSINLKKNNFGINVEYISEHAEEGFTFYSDFKAIISQDNKNLTTLNFKGCSKDQPHIFEGYMVPNSDVLLMLISNKGDCFEGGYVKETLHAIKGVKYYDIDIIRSFKPPMATEPNTGNAVVYANSANNQAATSTTSTASTNESKKPFFVFIWPVVFILIWVAFILGRKYQKNQN